MLKETKTYISYNNVVYNYSFRIVQIEMKA